MPQPSMNTEVFDNGLWNSIIDAGNQSSISASLSRTASCDDLTLLFLDNSQTNHLYFAAPAAAPATSPLASRIFPREVITLGISIVIALAGASLFVVPAVGLSLHTVTSAWRRGMLGWTILFVELFAAWGFLSALEITIIEPPFYVRLMWLIFEAALLYFRHKMWQRIPSLKSR